MGGMTFGYYFIREISKTYLIIMQIKLMIVQLSITFARYLLTLLLPMICLIGFLKLLVALLQSYGWWWGSMDLWKY